MIRSGFFNSINGDRKYDASKFAEYFASFIGNGVFPNPSTNLQVIANNDMTVTVKAGKCWINGYIMINDDDYILEIDPADGVLNRIDRIVARYDVVDREIRLEVKKGQFSSNPAAQNLQRDADAYELGLADVYIAAGVVSVTQANITDLRFNTELCGIVKGTVDQIDTTDLFAQYQTAFNDWFQEIKDVLDDNTAANLLNLINRLDDDLTAHKADYMDLKGYIGYTEDDIYGVEADFENNKFTRLAGAVGKNPGADFDSINAFGGRRRCNLADNGTVNAYYGDAGYKEDGSNGQVMVEQPKFYYKVVPLQLEPITDGIGYHLRKARYYISDTPKPGFKVHPAFVRNGKEVEKIYLSAYEGCIYDVSAGKYLLNDEQVADFNADKLSSIAYAKPASGRSQNLTRANSRKLANNRGAGWQLSDVLSASVTQILFIIEYASFDTQANIGLGVVNKTDDGTTNMSESTGATTNLGNTSGMAGMAAGTNGLVSVTYRGEENFWGNTWKWIDGLNIECKGIHQAYWADHDFQDNIKTSPYKNCGFTLAKSNGYVSAFGYSEDCDFLFLPTETLGNSSLPIGDYFYQDHASSGWRVSHLGGRWSDGSYAGGFYWGVNISSAFRGRSIGGRLLYVP